ncbi:MSCRAMM family protein [Levilactobacillus fujinensis]|uniref:Collagen binding domain-containing protein n=1 Tax=Levilactobacillus fujinensis TaxID=2486024 RepID=A0ABW1TKG8_9LACO|nr:SpaA isopeptide-forming pilin-related protein [Levilactobacillus fujinensis]
MKKWLRIFFLVTCLIGLTSVMRIQANKREGVIRTAALQDKSGEDVKSITSHQPEELQVAMTLRVPTGDTVIALENQEYAKFVAEEITDLEADKDITAEIDQEGRLLLNSDHDQVQKVELVVPINLADPLLMDQLQLELQVVNKNETYELAALAVKADSDAGSEAAAGSDNDNDSDKPTTDNNSNSNSDSSSQATSSSESAANTTRQNSQSAKQRSRATKSKTPATSSSKSASEEATDDDADADADTATKTSRVSQAANPLDNLTEPAIKIQRGQVKIGSWSDDMKIGGTLATQAGVAIYNKSSGADGKNVAGYYANELYRTHYYVSYQQKENAKSHAMVFEKGTDLDGETIIVYYPDVGAYTTSGEENEPDKKMGAIIEISKLVYSPNLADGKDAYIDLSSNFYSGIVYNGIQRFDLDITFTNEDGTRALNFPGRDGTDYKSYFTFGSLNGNEKGRHEWAGTKLKLPAKLSADTMVKDRGNGWYEGIGEGIYTKDKDGNYLPYTGENQWGDFLGSTNYEKGAVSFPLVNVKHEFMLRSDAGFTWQSFSTGSIVPLKPDKPRKTVHRTPDFGLENNNLDNAEISRDSDDLSKFYYTVYQPTYSIPDDSIAKPNKITLTDTLPIGMKTKPKMVWLYNTDGTRMKNVERGKVTVEGQKVTYELSDREIETLEFNGKPFAFQIKVKIDDDFVGIFKNKANVKFDSGVGYEWDNDTNEVVTEFYRSLILRKLGDSHWNPDQTEKLAGVVFNIEGGDDKRKVTTNDDGEIVLDKMNSKETYTFTEVVPAGYVAPQKFTLAFNASEKRWEIIGDSAQVEISNDRNQVITVTNQVVRGGYRFQKVDGTDDTQLAGAEFIIRNKDKKYLKFDDDGKLVGTAEKPEDATKLKSSASKTIQVTGLPYGDYDLIEVKAPAGYVIGATHKFTVSEKSVKNVEMIKNEPYSLPVTGGQGIIWFIVLGIMLTLSSLAIWRTHPRGG